MKTGDRMKCPDCGAVLIAKCGEVMKHHWAHEVNGACTYKMTAWHMWWQSLFGTDTELHGIWPRADGQGWHRPDIALIFEERPLVIEIQHSGMSKETMDAREDAYLIDGGRMVWIVDETMHNSRIWKHAFCPVIFDYPDADSVVFHDVEYERPKDRDGALLVVKEVLRRREAYLKRQHERHLAYMKRMEDQKLQREAERAERLRKEAEYQQLHGPWTPLSTMLKF